MLTRGVFYIVCVGSLFMSSLLFSEESKATAQGEMPEFALITIAKSGTNLINQCIFQLTKKKRTYIDRPQNFIRLNNNNYIGTHFVHIKAVNKTLAKSNIEKIIINVRDPRDVLVAAAFYYPEFRVINEDLYTDLASRYSFQNMSIPQRIRAYLNNGLAGGRPSPIFDIKEACSFIKNSERDFLVTKYEDLVGANGGGSNEAQKETILKVAGFLGIPATTLDTDRIGTAIYGGGPTFRKGKTGSWESYFNEDMKKMCKELLGKELIELGYESDYNW